tara:strand:- start:704 stop:2017 length:1314 start_codon:yes stop_codon:yes gene_type:complete
MLWRSPIILTPYVSGVTIDANRLASFIFGSYKKANLKAEDIDSGAVILTGEALKRKNARAIAELFADQSGKFVCASAGHHLEAVMAAHGSGVVKYSRQSHKSILNVDIGGGTTKLALAHEGQVIGQSAVAVGGRLVAFGTKDELIRVEEPALEIADSVGVKLELGKTLSPADKQKIIQAMVDVLVSACNFESWQGLGKKLALTPFLEKKKTVDAISFSGGVAEYIFKREQSDHGDIGVELANGIVTALKNKEISYSVYDPGNGIRATVIGASQFSVQVSGNTIFISSDNLLPLRNIPVVKLSSSLNKTINAEEVSKDIIESLKSFDITEGTDPVALAFRWQGDPLHERLYQLACGICSGFPKTIKCNTPLILVMDGDVGRTVGEILKNELDVICDIISIDGIELKSFDYVDIGEIIRPTNVVPLVIKSLLFSAGDTD